MKTHILILIVTISTLEIGLIDTVNYTNSCRLRRSYGEGCQGAVYCIDKLICNTLTLLCDCPRNISLELFWNGTSCAQSLTYNSTCTGNSTCKTLSQQTYCFNQKCVCPSPKIWISTKCGEIPAVCTGKKSLDNKCYATYHENVNFNWNQAKMACIAKSGSLATIDTTKKIQFIANNFAEIQYWVGAFRVTPSSSWQWIDNSSFTFNVNNDPALNCMTLKTTVPFTPVECISGFPDYLCEWSY